MGNLWRIYGSGWWLVSNPLKHMKVNWDDYSLWKNKQCSKPPTSFAMCGIPSGKPLQKPTETSTMETSISSRKTKTHHFDWAMASIANCDNLAEGSGGESLSVTSSGKHHNHHNSCNHKHKPMISSGNLT